MVVSSEEMLEVLGKGWVCLRWEKIWGLFWEKETKPRFTGATPYFAIQNAYLIREPAHRPDVEYNTANDEDSYEYGGATRRRTHHFD